MALSFQTALLACITSMAYASPLEHRAPSFGPVSLFENITVPTGWTAAGAVNSESVMTMQIALKQSNIAGLESKLLDISNPASANYGKWLSKEEVEIYTTPSTDTVNAVELWLASYGISASSISNPTPDWMEVTVPLSQAETMLSAKYSLFKNGATGKTIPRTTEYSIPLLLHNYIDTIQPTTAFSRNMGPTVHQNTTGTISKRQNNCDPNNIIPSCLQSYYNVDYTGNGQSSLAVTGFIDYSASHSDLTSFLNQYDSSISGAKFTAGSISGGQNQPSDPTLEGNLDTQFSVALGYPNPVTFYAVGPTDSSDNNEFSDELVNFGNFLNSASSPPSSVSTSYGGEEQDFSNSYLTRICNEFMKAGSRGVSIFFSSGDYGVGGNGESDCNDGFYVLFPASCPYITSVGATQFVDGGEQTAQFQNGGGSGGGFSNYFSAPSYQTADVNNYINNLDSSYSGYFNSQGRGYPDVALVGEYYDVVVSGSTEMVYGTSASSPSWAALISQINDYRISEGKSTLGFLNPALYSNAAALNDITEGYNYGCGTDGFPAAVGWDATTGLGSMNFAALRQALG